ncbi:hypothetical protein CDZ98_06800 [Mameliella alba]|nr:hypothetical protein CDZ98_06800 [Mameliella alba]
MRSVGQDIPQAPPNWVSINRGVDGAEMGKRRGGDRLAAVPVDVGPGIHRDIGVGQDRPNRNHDGGNKRHHALRGIRHVVAQIL